jgi:hypothetical protein
MHEETCLSKPIICQFCDTQVKIGQLNEHVIVCGSRTKLCMVCSKNVMLLDFEQHEKMC